MEIAIKPKIKTPKIFANENITALGNATTNKNRTSSVMIDKYSLNFKLIFNSLFIRKIFFHTNKYRLSNYVYQDQSYFMRLK